MQKNEKTVKTPVEMEINNNGKFISLGKRISGRIILLAVSACLILGVMAAVGSYNSALSALEKSVNETSKVAADRVTAELKEYKAIAYETGSIARLADESRSVEDKKAIIQQRVNDHNFTYGTIIDSEGNDIFYGGNVAGSEYFEQALAGNTYVSTPVFDEEKQQLSMVVAAPLWEGGIPHTSPIGAVIYSPQPDFLDNIMKTIQVGESGTALLTDRNGNTIGSTEPGKSGQENIIKLSEAETDLKDLASIIENMTQGKDGFGNYRFGGVSFIISYSPVSETDGWSLGVVVKRNEFLKSFFVCVILIVLIVLVTILTGLVVGKRTSEKIVSPIIQVVDRLKLLSEGDLHSEIPKPTFNDETAVLLKALAHTVAGLNGIIQDINNQTGEMSKGNFSIEIDKKYAGDFVLISDSFQKIVKTLQDAFREIDSNANLVSDGADNLSKASLTLADGATDQSSSVEELNASINEMTDRIQKNAQSAEEARKAVLAVNEKIGRSNQEMQKATNAMERIIETSKQIEQIVYTIQDIATQTNLLSLNAAIEAARAGEAGKGFAVVAGEVGSLADQSAEAAKNTTRLIRDSIHAVEEGTSLMEIMSQSLEEIVDDSAGIKREIESIAAASENQAEAAEQILDAVNQIAAVVEENSATAEESAAASEELSTESEHLKRMISKFQY